MPDVSIVIVNWNTCAITCECLESIYAQACQTSYEVIVIDNHSSDRSVIEIESRYPDVVLVKNGENRGFAAANNQGIERATGHYILLLNSDTIVLNNAVEACKKIADQYPKVGVMGCRVLNRDRSLQPSCFMFPSVINMLLSVTYMYKLNPKSKVFGRERMTWWDFNDARNVDVVSGCFMLIRREAIESAGMMDETFFMYGEETDWCFRFDKFGWKTQFTPAAEIIHLGGASSRLMKPEMILQLRGSILHFMKKHRGAFAYSVSCILTSIFYLLRIPYWFLVSVTKPGSKTPRQYVITYAQGSFRALCGWRALCIRQRSRTS